MIYLILFLEFFKVGLFTFGGGYAMIPLVKEVVLSHGWMSEEHFIDMIGLSEMTPGPIAINMATFVGSEQGGILGSVIATFGVVLPSFIIITLIVKLLYKFMKKKAVQEVFLGVRSSVTGLLMAVLLTLVFTVIFNMSTVYSASSFSMDWTALGMFIAMIPLAFIKLEGKKIHPIIIILISAILGLILYGFIPQAIAL